MQWTTANADQKLRNTVKNELERLLFAERVSRFLLNELLIPP